MAAGSAIGLAGCAGSGVDESNAYTIVPYLDPTGDRDWENWSGMTPYWTRVVEPLVWGTEDMQPKPWLATDWEATDDTTWVFELREGVTFHNGKEMTADDIVHSFEDDILTEYGDFVYGWLHLEPGSVEKIDEYTVEFNNTDQFAGFPGTIAHDMIDIHPPEADPWNGNVIGTGPFTVEGIEDGQHVRIERFGDYWGGDVEPEALVFKAAEDVTTRTNMLEGGDADIILNPAKNRVSSLRDDDSVQSRHSSPPDRTSSRSTSTGSRPTILGSDERSISLSLRRKSSARSSKGSVFPPGDPSRRLSTGQSTTNCRPTSKTTTGHASWSISRPTTARHSPCSSKTIWTTASGSPRSCRTTSRRLAWMSIS